MSEKEISTLIKSIVDSCRTFYVGTASAIDDEGYVTLNGIRAAVVGIAEQADVILKDATSGAWVAFIRGTGEVVSTNTIKLYLSLPTQGEISLYFFVSAESLQNVLTVRGVRQIVGVFGFTTSKPYYTQLAPWLVSIPGAFSFEGDYLNSQSPKSNLHLTANDASFTAVGDLLEMNVSSKSLPGTAAINIKKIEVEPNEEQVFIQFYIQPSIAISGIRQTIERWSVGLSKNNYTGKGAFGAASLAKSLGIGFKNELPRNYSKFYAWYRHNFVFALKWRPLDSIYTVPGCEDAGVVRKVTTEFPVSEVFSDFKHPTSPFYRNYDPSIPAYSPPLPTLYLPDFSIFADFHFGDGSFGDGSPGSEENVTTLEFPHSEAGLVNSRSISYEVEKGEVLAKRMKLFILVEGVKHYARHVNYDGTNYRLGFFEAAQNPADTDLVYYGNTEPRQVDTSSVNSFLLPLTLIFSTPASESSPGNGFFPGDDFLWSSPFREGTFSATGFIDSTFPESGDKGPCTFIRAEKEEVEEGTEGGYATPTSIQIEFLPPEQWAYKESLNFFSAEGSFLRTVESPLPRITPDTQIRVSFRENSPSLEASFPFSGKVLAGRYGKARELTPYYSLSQRILYVTLNFQKWSTTPDATDEAEAEGGGSLWERHYFPGKSEINIVHEYTGNVARKAKLYIDRGGTRYYGHFFSITTYLQFFEEIVATPTIFHVELGSETPRRFIGGAGNNSETLVSDPFDGRTLRFTSVGSGDKELEWLEGNVFERSGFASSVVGGGFRFYNRDTFPATRLPVTIQIEFAPEEEWAKTESVTLDGSIVINSDFVVKGGEGQTNAYLRAIAGGANTDMSEYLEISKDLDQFSSRFYTFPGMITSCSTSTLTINQRMDFDNEVFYRFLHLSSGSSSSIDLSATTLSFAESSLIVYANGRVSFQGIDLIPFSSPLDTSHFIPEDPFTSGYVSCVEGYVDDHTTGVNEVPCLRIDWRRAYPYVPGSVNYYSKYGQGIYVDFEVLFIDLEDRIDVIYRYLYLSYESNPEDPATFPFAGITEESCVFPGSGEYGGANEINGLVDRKVSSNNPGEVRFYIKDGEVHGYNEITLFEDGSTDLPIRRCIPPIEDLYREICGLIRIEEIREPSLPVNKKVSLYISSNIVDNEVDLTDPLPPTLVAETNGPDAFDQPPLENANGII